MIDLIEYRTIDKSGWVRGPWDDEPDKAQWYDEATGLPCLMVRGPVGALCGYVGVRPGHPWHGQHYDACEAVGEEYGPNVHGGLTYADSCGHGPDPSKGICHIPAPGDTDDVWWLGFDCAHSGDMTSMNYREHFENWGKGRDIYRDYAYVRREIASLAKQAAAIATEARRAATTGAVHEGAAPQGDRPNTGTNPTPQSDERIGE